MSNRVRDFFSLRSYWESVLEEAQILPPGTVASSLMRIYLLRVIQYLFHQCLSRGRLYRLAIVIHVKLSSWSARSPGKHYQLIVNVNGALETQSSIHYSS